MTAQRPPAASPSPRRLMVTIFVMMAVIMQVLDITIANVSLPYMQASLSATLDQVSWVLTSYVVAAAVMTAPVGWLANRFGIKLLLLICVTGFTLASMLCGIAQNIEEMVLFRVLQGMFGAALVPLSQSVMFGIYPPEQRGWAMSLCGMGVMIGPIMGPCSGACSPSTTPGAGSSTSTCPSAWPPCIGLLAFMDETEGNRSLVFDWLGFAAFSIAIGALQLMLDRGEQLGWFDSGEIVLMAIVSATAFYFFIAHSLTTERPFIPIEIFRDRNFIVGLVFMFVIGMLAGGDHGADGAPAAGRDGLSDPRCRPAPRNAAASAWRWPCWWRARSWRASTGASSSSSACTCCVVSLYYSIDFTPDTTIRTIVWISMLQGRDSASCSCRSTPSRSRPSRRRCARKAPPCGR